MFRKIVVSALSFAVFGQLTAQADWKHQKLELYNENNPSDVVTVSIDYEVKATPNPNFHVLDYAATPVHINAWSPRPADSAQAVFRSMFFNSYSMNLAAILSGQYEYFLSTSFTDVLDLEVEGNHLFASLRQPVMLLGTWGYKNTPRGVQELAIVIDGIWYKGLNKRDARFSMMASDRGY
jgi:hypothetical protein